MSYADAGFEAVVRRADLSVREVFVRGRIRAPLKEVAAAVSVKRGDSMFSGTSHQLSRRIVFGGCLLSESTSGAQVGET